MRIKECLKSYEIRNSSPNIKYAYIMRKTDDPHVFEFVADADSNTNIPYSGTDYNFDGTIDPSDNNVAPGVQYYSLSPVFGNGMKEPTFGKDFESDQWGTFLTGTAPIYNDQHQPVALLGLDMEVTDLYALARRRFIPVFLVATLLFIVAVLRIFKA